MKARNFIKTELKKIINEAAEIVRSFNTEQEYLNWLKLHNLRDAAGTLIYNGNDKTVGYSRKASIGFKKVFVTSKLAEGTYPYDQVAGKVEFINKKIPCPKCGKNLELGQELADESYYAQCRNKNCNYDGTWADTFKDLVKYIDGDRA